MTFASPSTLPDEFDLTIQRKEKSFRARVIWRTGDEAGVAFVDPAASSVIPLDWARRLRDCEQQNATLKGRVADLSTGY